MDQGTSLAMLAPAACPVLLLDETGRIISSNAAAQRLLGLSPEQLATRSCQVAPGPELPVDASSPSSIATRDLVLVQGDGADALVVKANAVHVDSSAGTPHTLLLLISQCPIQSEGLRISSTALAEAARDLRAPLWSIAGHLDLLLGQQGATRRMELEKILRVMRRNVALVQHLTCNLLAAVDACSTDVKLNLQSTSLTDLMEEAIGGVAILAEGKQQSIVQVLPAGPARVLADRPRVVQALGNMLFSAIRNMAERSLVTLSASPVADYWRISVCDYSPTSPWWQRDRASATDGLPARPDETDLGIAVVKAVVELHGGTVGLTSSPEHGNTFWFTLPKADVAGPEGD